jgi:hypothetical protein
MRYLDMLTCEVRRDAPALADNVLDVVVIGTPCAAAAQARVSSATVIGTALVPTPCDL